jgi:hypothetical protein
VRLKRRGRVIDILNGPILPFAQASGFFGANFEEIKGQGTPVLRQLVAAAASTDEILLQTCFIKLHDVINLTEDDVLEFEIQVPSGAAAATVSQAESEILWDFIEGIGNGASVPFMTAESIRASESNTPVTLGSNIVEAFFINNEKAGITTANKVINTVSISSDKLNRNDTVEELIAKRAAMFDDSDEADSRDNCFLLFSTLLEKHSGGDVRLNKANLRMTFTAANVTAGKNWVVTRGYHNDATTFNRARIRGAKHSVQNNSQY